MMLMLMLTLILMHLVAAEAEEHADGRRRRVGVLRHSENNPEPGKKRSRQMERLLVVVAVSQQLLQHSWIVFADVIAVATLAVQQK